MTDLEGIWVCVSWISGGVRAKKLVRSSLTLELLNGRYRLRRAGSLMAERLYSVDETKEPYELRTKLLDGAESNTFIYKIEAGFLTICTNVNSFDPPRGFLSNKPKSPFASEVDLITDLKTWRKIDA